VFESLTIQIYGNIAKYKELWEKAPGKLNAGIQDCREK
jgi:hypothetical protein